MATASSSTTDPPLPENVFKGRWGHWFKHPEHPEYLSFPYSMERDHVTIFVLYDDDMRSDDVQIFLDELKEELKLKKFDYFYFCGRVGVFCDREDMPRLYEIVTAVLKKGKRLMMNDSTEVTFDPTDAPASLSKQLDLQLASYLEFDCTMRRCETRQTILDTVRSLEIWKRNYWRDFSSGRQYACTLMREYGQRFELKDPEGEAEDELHRRMLMEKYGSKTSEAKVEDSAPAAPQSSSSTPTLPIPKRKREEDAEPELCTLCENAPRETMVLPCMHSVCCKACAVKLKNDPAHRNKCIICRGAVWQVLIEGE